MNAALQKPRAKTSGGASSGSDLASAHGRYFALRTSLFDLRHSGAVAVQERDLNGDDDFADDDEVVYYHSNTLYSVYALTDADENVVERMRYDAYGAATVLDADFSSDADGASDVENPYTFTARRLDAESDLMQYRNRYYDPGLGRFAGRDPAGHSDAPNFYLYVQGRPTVSTDPLGLCSTRRDALDEALNRNCEEAYRCWRIATRKDEIRCVAEARKDAEVGPLTKNNAKWATGGVIAGGVIGFVSGGGAAGAIPGAAFGLFVGYGCSVVQDSRADFSALAMCDELTRTNKRTGVDIAAWCCKKKNRFNPCLKDRSIHYWRDRVRKDDFCR